VKLLMTCISVATDCIIKLTNVGLFYSFYTCSFDVPIKITWFFKYAKIHDLTIQVYYEKIHSKGLLQ